MYFVNKKQYPLDLYRLHTIPVPLDLDNYDGKENKYTHVQFKNTHLAISKWEYMEINQKQLDSCLQLHMDYLCANLRHTASAKVLLCAAALFQIKSPDNVVVHEVCQIAYYEYYSHHQLFWKHKMRFFLLICL